ncbi:MAG: response regulator [Chthoniobacterales bacterium]
MLSVLAVEDDPSVARAVATVLRGPDCSIIVASSAEEALDAVAHHPRGFDVVITDNNMPVVSGGELVRRLRASNFHGRIVVLSAYVSPQQQAEYRENGVNVMLSKPFAISDLRRAVGLPNETSDGERA